MRRNFHRDFERRVPKSWSRHGGTFFEVNHREIHEGPDRRGATDRLMAQWGSTRVALTRFGYLHPDLNVFREVTGIATAMQEVVDDLDKAAMYFGFQTDNGLTRAGI